MVAKNGKKLAPGGDRTLDLRIYFSAAYKYDALTDWATGASHVNDVIFFETYCFGMKLIWA